MSDAFDVRVIEELADDLGDLAARRLAKQFSDALERRLQVLASAAADGSVRATPPPLGKASIHRRPCPVR